MQICLPWAKIGFCKICSMYMAIASNWSRFEDCFAVDAAGCVRLDYYSGITILDICVYPVLHRGEALSEAHHCKCT